MRPPESLFGCVALIAVLAAFACATCSIKSAGAQPKFEVIGSVDVKTRRLLTSFTVHGKPVVANLDTGCNFGFALVRRTVMKHDLPFDWRTVQSRARYLKGCDVAFAGSERSDAVAVLPHSGLVADFARTGVEGVVGWPAIRDRVVEINWDRLEIRLWKELPGEVAAWSSWEIQRENAGGMLGVTTRLLDLEKARVLLDTGGDLCVDLHNRPWDAKFGRGDHPLTLSAGYSIRAGLFAALVAMPRCARIGEHEVRDVTVRRAPERSAATVLEMQALFGVRILSRFHLFIDGKAQRVFVKPRDGVVWPPDHNRLGAYFLPFDAPENEQIVARVAKSGAAYRRGIRDGDVLVSIDGWSAMRLFLKEGPAKMSARWRKPAGTRYRLKLERAGREFEVEVELEEILPDAKK